MSGRWRCATLALVTFVGACGGGDGGPGKGSWELKAEAAGSNAPSLRTVGREGPPGEPPARAVILSFDCLPGHAISTIMTDQQLRQGSVEIRLTLDADSPRRLAGFAGTTPSGGQLVLTSPQDSVLALLSGHQRATIEYEDGAGSSKSTAVFPVAGLDRYRTQFLAACAKRGGGSK
jgi:hypothetical protein